MTRTQIDQIEAFVRKGMAAQVAVDKIIRGEDAMSAHTPGPWQVGKQITENMSRPLGWTWVETLTGRRSGHGIAQCYGKDQEANARLIAQAPAMLEALEGFVGYYDGKTHMLGNGYYARRFYEKARAILDAVKGETR